MGAARGKLINVATLPLPLQDEFLEAEGMVAAMRNTEFAVKRSLIR